MIPSIHDELPRSASELETDRVEAVMARVSRTDLEKALVIMLGAARQAEGQALALERRLTGILRPCLLNNLDNINDQLICEGIDRVVDLLGVEAVQILEEEA